MGIKHESGHEAIRLSASGVSGARAVDGYLLRFSITYQLSAWQSKFGSTRSTFRAFRARIDAGDNRLRLGRADAEYPQILTPYEFDQSSSVMFELLVPPSTIEAIEKLRAGQGFEVSAQIACERVGERLATEHDDVLFRINQSQWVEVLKQMDYCVSMLVEIPVVPDDNGDLSDVRIALNSAGQLLHTGHYSSAVTECRKALETMLSHAGRTDLVGSAVRQYGEGHKSRQAMSKRERLNYLINAARHATHLGAHPDASNRTVDYSREEALMIYCTVASAINHVARDLETD